MHFVQPALAHTVAVPQKLPFFLINSFGWDFRILVCSLGIGQPQQPAISPGFSSSREFLPLFHIPRLQAAC